MALHVFLFMFQVQQNQNNSAYLRCTYLLTRLTFTSPCQGARYGKRNGVKRRLNLLLQFYQEAVARENWAEKKQRGRLKIKHVRTGRPSPGWGQLYSRQTTPVPSPTSSTGSSLSLGRELESSPTRKGVGQHTMSIMDEGRTGMKVCCQEKGYSRATTACEQLERVLGREGRPH